MSVPRLDRAPISRLNFGVRTGVVVAVLSVAFAAAAVSAPAPRPRGGVTFAVGKGGDTLGYLAPELVRALTAALEAAGADAASDAIAGRLDELSGDRVRIGATVHGRAVFVDGQLERLDELAAELATRIAPMLKRKTPDVSAVGKPDKTDDKRGIKKDAPGEGMTSGGASSSGTAVASTAPASTSGGASRGGGTSGSGASTSTSGTSAHGSSTHGSSTGSGGTTIASTSVTSTHGTSTSTHGPSTSGTIASSSGAGGTTGSGSSTSGSGSGSGTSGSGASGSGSGTSASGSGTSGSGGSGTSASGSGGGTSASGSGGSGGSGTSASGSGGSGTTVASTSGTSSSTTSDPTTFPPNAQPSSSTSTSASSGTGTGTASSGTTNPPPPYPPYAQPPPPRAWPPAARNRVVAHAIPDSPSAFAGSGIAATQALYYFLSRRMHMQVLPGAIGLASPNVATDEAWRLGARAVVMGRLESIAYFQQPGGTSLRCRVELVVVRDGHVVLRRVVESAPTPVAQLGARRGRELDPVFLAVSQALEALAPDLQITFAGN
jgi:hypothetical protein